MKKLLIIVILAILPCAVFAQNNMFNNPNKNPFTNKDFYGSANVSMDYKFNSINPYGEAKPDTVTTLGLNLRYDYFDFFGYIGNIDTTGHGRAQSYQRRSPLAFYAALRTSVQTGRQDSPSFLPKHL